MRVLLVERNSSEGVDRPARGRPSYTRVHGPGCYGEQIDGAGFSSVIVFRALRR